MSDTNAATLPVVTLFDTLTGKKQELQTLEPGRCGIYCCGPDGLRPEPSG